MRVLLDSPLQVESQDNCTDVMFLVVFTIIFSDTTVLYLLFVDMEHEENNIMFKGKATITMTTFFR